jgi:hypothetical protein
MMGTVFEIQYPQGVIHHVEPGVDSNDYSPQWTMPGVGTNAVVLPEVNPFVAWALGAITEIEAATPYDLQVVGICIANDSGTGALGEIHLFTGAPAAEVPLAQIAVDVGKRDVVPVQTPIIPAGTRISGAMVAAVELDEDLAVRLLVKPASEV